MIVPSIGMFRGLTLQGAGEGPVQRRVLQLLGFLTAKPNAPVSLSLTSRLQLFRESANVSCNFTNPVRSSLRGLAATGYPIRNPICQA